MEASIATMDNAFGHVVEAVRSSVVANNTLVVFTTDHGIPFPHAKMTLYDPGIEVALMFGGPGIPQGVTRQEMISNVDIMPTLLDLIGMRSPSNLQGRSFIGLLANGAYKPNERIFAEKTYHTYYDPMRAVRGTRWKLIANFECAPGQETSPDYFNNAKGYPEVADALAVPREMLYHPPFEMYDLRNDPYEQHNVADRPDLKGTRDGLVRDLHKWMRDTDDPLLDGPIAQGAYHHRIRAFTNIGSKGT
jgi:arylsulfatase A-like enzyme